MRAPRYEDHERWAAGMASPAVGAGLGKPDGLTPHEAFVDMSVVTAHWALRGFGHWALEVADSGELVGRAGLYFPPDWPGLEVGWTIWPEHWGNGYAPEAGRAACVWAHAELGATHILSLIEPGNARSIRVAEKLGETYEGVHRARSFELLVYGRDLPLRPAGTRAA